MPLVLRPDEEMPLRFNLEVRQERYTIAAKSLSKVLDEGPPQTRPDAAHPNCVSILDPETNIAATGFVMNTIGFVLTCFHIGVQFVGNPQALERYRIRETDGTLSRIDPTFFAYDPHNDIAFLRAMRGTERRIPPVKFHNRDPVAKEGIFYLSFKEGESPRLHRGVVIGINQEGLLEFEGYGELGYSGSPLFNQAGYFIGTLSRKGSQDGRACARRVHHARSLLEEVIANLNK